MTEAPPRPGSRRLGPLRLGVVVPALDAADRLPATLAALNMAADTLDIDLVVADGGSTDATADTAERAGARLVAAPRGRGTQLAAGAKAVSGDWLLFVHADTVLDAGWAEAAAEFAGDPANAGRAGYFRFALDDVSPEARRLERRVAWRCRTFGLPYGDQGLLVSRARYEAVGGFRPLALMEDVDLVRRLGRRSMTALPARAVTSAERFRRGGYTRRSLRNLLCLLMFYSGLPVPLIKRIYYA